MRRMARERAIRAFALVVLASAGAGAAPLHERAHGDSPGRAQKAPSPTRGTSVPSPPSGFLPRSCMEELGSIARVTIARPPASAEQSSCPIEDPVILASVAAGEADKRIEFPDRPLLACRMALALARFSAGPLVDITSRHFGKRPVAIATGPGFECRPRNRQPGAKMSAHGAGLAVDVSRFVLGGGEALALVATPTAFLREFRDRACETFNTVLGPGSDDFHVDHVHLDLETRGQSGNVKYCR